MGSEHSDEVNGIPQRLRREARPAEVISRCVVSMSLIIIAQVMGLERCRMRLTVVDAPGGRARALRCLPEMSLDVEML